MSGGKYAEAAKAGILSLMRRREHDAGEVVDEEMTAKNALENYRMLLAEEGVAADQDAAPELGQRIHLVRPSKEKNRQRTYFQLINSKL